jgi:hypothetical protein
MARSIVLSIPVPNHRLPCAALEGERRVSFRANRILEREIDNYSDVVEDNCFRYLPALPSLLVFRTATANQGKSIAP